MLNFSGVIVNEINVDASNHSAELICDRADSDVSDVYYVEYEANLDHDSGSYVLEINKCLHIVRDGDAEDISSREIEAPEWLWKEAMVEVENDYNA